jgi:hypothetical protein
MPGYKYPNIDSGATPIGSAGRAPDRKTISRKNPIRRDKEGEDLSKEEMKRKKIGAYDRLQVPDHSLGGSTPIGSAGHAPDEELLRVDN